MGCWARSGIAWPRAALAAMAPKFDPNEVKASASVRRTAFLGLCVQACNECNVWPVPAPVQSCEGGVPPPAPQPQVLRKMLRAILNLPGPQVRQPHDLEVDGSGPGMAVSRPRALCWLQRLARSECRPRRRRALLDVLCSRTGTVLVCQVGDDIVKGTSQWKGIRVTVKLTIQNRAAKASLGVAVFFAAGNMCH